MRRLSAVLYVPDTAAGTDDPVKMTLYTLTDDLQGAVVDVRLKAVFSFGQDLRGYGQGMSTSRGPLQVPA